MGYISEVAIVTAPGVEWPEEVRAELERYAAIEEDGNRRLWHHPAVKWYEEFFMATQRWLSEMEDDQEFGFIRLGEDDCDTEIEGSPFSFGVGRSRRIDFD